MSMAKKLARNASRRGSIIRSSLVSTSLISLVRKVEFCFLGLHASISTHICQEHLDTTTGEWVCLVQHVIVGLLNFVIQGPDLQCFVTRIASHPERLQYIYFNTVLLLRAVARIGPYLSAYDYCSSGTHEEDAATLGMLTHVINIAQTVGKFDESVLFRGENANVSQSEVQSRPKH